MNHYLIEITWSEEDEGFIATVPDLPGCSAWGRTAAEAAKEIEDAQAAWIQACKASGEPVPEPRTLARRAA
jgi:predicted RNase H-like HicB family nuclease